MYRRRCRGSCIRRRMYIGMSHVYIYIYTDAHMCVLAYHNARTSTQAVYMRIALSMRGLPWRLGGPGSATGATASYGKLAWPWRRAQKCRRRRRMRTRFLGCCQESIYLAMWVYIYICICVHIYICVYIYICAINEARVPSCFLDAWRVFGFWEGTFGLGEVWEFPKIRGPVQDPKY